MPKRPLSAYNLFFQRERQAILGDKLAREFEVTASSKRKHRKTHGKIGFADMARSIGLKWKQLDSDARCVFEEQAKFERERYSKEMEEYRKNESTKTTGLARQVTLDGACSSQNNESLQNSSLLSPTKLGGPKGSEKSQLDCSYRVSVGASANRPESTNTYSSKLFQISPLDARCTLRAGLDAIPVSQEATACEASMSTLFRNSGLVENAVTTTCQLDEASLLRFQLAAVANIRNQIRCQSTSQLGSYMEQQQNVIRPRVCNNLNSSYQNRSVATFGFESTLSNTGSVNGLSHLNQKGLATESTLSSSRSVNGLSHLNQNGLATAIQAVDIQQALRERSAHMAWHVFLLRQGR